MTDESQTDAYVLDLVPDGRVRSMRSRSLRSDPPERVAVRLGLRIPDVPPLVPLLAAYVDAAALPAPPPACDYHTAVGEKGFPMYANDRIGNCAVAAPGHMHQAWTRADTGGTVTIPEAEIVKAYSAISGYDPRTGRNDNGCFLADVLAHWRRTGIGGRRILGHVAVAPADAALLRTAIHHFGGLDLGIAMPAGWQRQTGPGGVWTEDAGRAGSWGGHSVNVTGYDERFVYCVTWGLVQRMTWAAFKQYVFEAYAVLSTDWLNADWTAPTGIRAKELVGDLKKWGGASDPVEDPPAPPVDPPKPRTVTVATPDLRAAGIASLTVAFAG